MYRPEDLLRLHEAVVESLQDYPDIIQKLDRCVDDGMFCAPELFRKEFCLYLQNLLAFVPPEKKDEVRIIWNMHLKTIKDSAENKPNV